MEFKNFGSAVAKQFAEMAKGALFRVSLGKDDQGNDITKDALWAHYLASYPEGSNPIYKVRTEHDCNCCKQFIRAVGNVVAAKDNKLVSIWDVVIKNEPEYQVVADAMAKLVKSAKISDHFLHSEASAGSARTFHQLISGGQFSWDHFNVTIPRQFVVFGKDIPSRLNDLRGNHDVLLRSIKEFDDGTVELVSELMAQGSLYRGNEYKPLLEEFKKIKTKTRRLNEEELDNFVWASGVTGGLARIRNTAMGTLLVDLAGGMELEPAVKRWENVMAPANYKRPTALVTKKMVEDARKKVEELGLTSALERRYAKLDDIKITDLLFANRSTKSALSADPFDLVTVKAPVKNFDGVEEIHIDKFISDILPKAQKVEVMLENRHKGNFVSLVVPVDPTANQLFKWDNGFSWSYNGDFADSSIKEKVKAAGGNVGGELCCRLAWYNYSDLDFHMVEPSGREISYCSKFSSLTKGQLDVDMNAGMGRTREPVENIFYSSIADMQNGKYQLYVYQFNERDKADPGFEVEIDMLGQVFNFTHEKAIRQGEKVVVAEFTVKNGKITIDDKKLPSKTKQIEVWGVKTNEFVEVSAIMNSPNAWGDKVIGNKHFFFMLNGCENEGVARGFYNEFLRSDLDKHRKVLEMVGSKMKTDTTKDQLSGVGFSDTKRDSILVKVSGSFTRIVKVNF